MIKQTGKRPRRGSVRPTGWVYDEKTLMSTEAPKMSPNPKKPKEKK